MRPLSIREIRAQLEAERLPVPGEAAIAAALREEEAPWFVRVLAGAGGWAAAAFLATGIALVAHLRAGAEMGALGAAVCVAATAGRRWARGAFAGQLALAASLAGQGLFAAALLADASRPLTGRLLIVAAAEAALVAVFADPVHRFLSTAFAAAALFGACHEAGWTPAFPVLAGAALLAIWTAPGRSFRPPLAALRRPVGYGLALAFAAAFVWPAIERHVDVAADVIADRTAAAGVAAVALGIAGTRAFVRLRVPLSSSAGTLALVGGAGIVALGTEAPGVPGALALVALAVESREPLLFAVGSISGAAYLSWWYGDLSTTLLVKSGVLAASGVLLLLLRGIAFRRRAA